MTDQVSPPASQPGRPAANELRGLTKKRRWSGILLLAVGVGLGLVIGRALSWPTGGAAQGNLVATGLVGGQSAAPPGPAEPAGTEVSVTSPVGPGLTRSTRRFASFVRAVSASDPATAAEWAQSSGDEGQRLRQTESVAREWLNEDPTTAQAWVDSRSFPSDVRERLLKRRL